MQELSPADFEYKFVESAFTRTGKPEFDKQAAGVAARGGAGGLFAPPSGAGAGAGAHFAFGG